MEENKFFTFVWRFNGLVIAVAAVLLIGVLAFAGYEIIGDVTRDRSVHNIVNVQDNTEIQEQWHFGYMSVIQGSQYVMIPLDSNQTYSQTYSSKSASSTRNYLFINSSDNEKHWLFNSNKYLIENYQLLSDKDSESKSTNVHAILYTYVKSDTNGDKRLTNDDQLTLGLSLPNGKGFKEVIDGIDVFVGQVLIDKNKLLVLYQRNNVGYSANISLSSFSISNESELPKIAP